MSLPERSLSATTDSSSGPKFRYQPLNTESTIRILILHSANELEAPLVTDLIHEDRAAIPADDDAGSKYWEAVSYTWGDDPKFSCTIRCNGFEMAVTPNVDTLLRYLRRAHKTRRLWIDAICLDQGNDEEKKLQVQRMGEIYSEAHKVVVWLGLDEDIVVDSATVLPLSAIAARLRVIKAQYRNTHTRPKTLSSADHILVRKFLELPWFHRRWTIQEVALHSHVILQLSNVKMNWSELKAALEFLHQELKLQYGGVDSISLSLERFFWIYSQYTSILDLLWMFSSAACSDDQDRIAAFQGMQILKTGPIFSKSEVIVDYTLPWHTNYVSATRSILSGIQYPSSNPDCTWKLWVHLMAFGNLGHSDPHLPSWAPDWRQSRKTLLPFEEFISQSMQSHSDIPPNIIFNPGNRSLEVQQIPQEADSFLRGPNSLWASVSIVLKVQSSFSLSLKGDHPLIELSNLFLRAPTWVLKAFNADRGFLGSLFYDMMKKTYRACGFDSNIVSCHLAQFKMWTKRLHRSQLMRNNPDLDGSEHNNNCHQPPTDVVCQKAFDQLFAQQICSILKDRVIFLDAAGHLGLASSGVAEQDWLLAHADIVKKPPFAKPGSLMFRTYPCIAVRVASEESILRLQCPVPVVRYVGVAAVYHSVQRERPTPSRYHGDIVFI